ncbi:MAG: hypothetical protein ABJG88_11705 [Litorimonas sp.]
MLSCLNMMWKSRILMGACACVGLTNGLLHLSYADATDRPFFSAQALVIVVAASEDESNGGVAPIAVDFALLTPSSSGNAAPDLIGVDGFVFNQNSGFDAGHDFSGGATRLEIENQVDGGRFNNGGGDADYLEANDTLTSFGLDSDADVTTFRSRSLSRFLVASNAPFDVFAQASNLTTSGDFTSMDYSNIGFLPRLNTSGGSGAGRYGDRAQNPSIGGGGIDTSLNDLGDISSGPTKMFDGGRRTAQLSGTILEQSVSFNIRYALAASENGSSVNSYDFSQGVGTIGADVTYTVYTP